MHGVGSGDAEEGVFAENVFGNDPQTTGGLSSLLVRQMSSCDRVVRFFAHAKKLSPVVRGSLVLRQPLVGSHTHPCCRYETCSARKVTWPIMVVN